MSKKSGPTRKFPLEMLTKLFEKYEEEIVLQNGKILRPSAPFWAEIKKNYEMSATTKSIYTDATKWLKKSEYEKKNQLDCRKNNDFDESLEEEIQVSPSGSSEDEIESYDDDSSNGGKSDIQFSIKLTYNLWSLIQPTSRSYHRRADSEHKKSVRNHLVLKPGFWSNVFVDKIAEHPKNIICDWSFKYGRVTPDGKNYVVIYANCINCQSKLFAFLKSKPIENEEVTFRCIVKDFNGARHEEANKKVKVSGSQAQSLATSSKPAIVLHRKLSAKSGKIFELPKGRVPTPNAIRKLQSRNRSKERLSPDTFKSLLYMQASKKYAQTIRMIGLSPFFIIFGSDNQFRLYKMYEKQNPLSKISCDATGSLVRKIGKYINAIFYYSMY